MSAEISGTWDFKWPQGSVIRVAFQELPERDATSMPSLAKIIDKYCTAATRWLEGKPAPNVHFEFLKKRLPAPEAVDGEQNLRSPRGGPHVAYDVLVSFASTPAKVVAEKRRDETHITGQLSVLGSYARRINYGTPTSVLGPNRDFIPEGKALGDYFDDPFFEEIVVHEVGHVLGIPHQHQNPLYGDRPRLKSDEQIKSELKTIRRVYWTKFSPPIASEISNLWPALPNTEKSPRYGKGPAVPFSDWRPIQSKSEPLELVTVMAHPIWSRLTTERFPATRLAAARQPRTRPFAFDLELLQAMYPHR